MNDWHRIRAVLLTATLFALGACAMQPGLTGEEIDRATLRAMQLFNVPGAVVGVVKDGEIVHSGAYGVLEATRPEPVGPESLFRIASTSKAMTATALAMIVERGLLTWDDRVIDHIPSFKLYDPWMTAHFSVADLLTHRSGLAPFAGDLMLWPKPNSFTRKDVLYGLRYFKPAREFRTGYDYDNLLYVVAGELIPAVTGQQWAEFVDEHILAGLRTDRCFAGRIPDNEMLDLAAPHAMVDGMLQVVERNRIQSGTAVAAAAGGVRCSLGDMLKWIQLQLDRGQLPGGKRLFSRSHSELMWSPHTIQSVSAMDFERDRTHFKAYGLGWRLADVNGYKQVHHSGSFTGFNTLVVLIPELNLGAVVMLNASAGSARTAIVNTIIRPYLGDRETDWIDYFAIDDGETTAADDDVSTADYRSGSVDRPLIEYSGAFRDPWFGEVRIGVTAGSLRFSSDKSPKLEGRLWPQGANTFMLRWEDRTAERDVFVDFVFADSGRPVGLEIRCLAESIQCAFEDQEMNFKRIGEE